MAVYERGSYRDRRKDLGWRTLVVGLGLLPGVDQSPFRAVLAHEHGLGRESGKPVRVVTPQTDLSAKLKRGIAFARWMKKGQDKSG